MKQRRHDTPLQEALEFMCHLLVANKDPSRNVREELQKEAINIDGDLFEKLVYKHRLQGLICQALEGFQIPMDDRIKHRLKTKYEDNQIQSLKRIHDLFVLLDYFKEEEIDYILLKGPGLAMGLYGDLSLRHSKDLDILVDIRHLKKADMILKKLGYRELMATDGLSERENKSFEDKRHHRAYLHETSVEVEIHWKLIEGFYTMDFQDLLKIRSYISLMGKDVFVLSDEENFIYLLIHGSKHAFHRLKWLYDLYLFLQKKDMDWKVLRARIEEIKIANLWQEMSILLDNYFSYQVLEKPIIRTSEYRDGSYLAELATLFIETTEDSPTEAYGTTFKESIYYKWHWFGTPKRKIHYVIDNMKPGLADFEKWKLEDSRYYLYYILRPYRLVKTYVFKSR